MAKKKATKTTKPKKISPQAGDIEIEGRGRPRAVLDWEKLNIVLRFGGTKRDASEICEVSEDTIDKRIREDFDMTFTEYKEQKMAFLRMKILQKQYEIAMKGNVTMLIFMGKNYCNQTDKYDVHSMNTNNDNKSIKIEFVKPNEIT